MVTFPGRGGLLRLAERGKLVSADLAQRLFNMFFLGQFFLVALVAPSFAAGSITGEKERKTYEMLLASPLQPTSILVGKLLSSLTYLVILILSSLTARDHLLPAGRDLALGDRAGVPDPDPGGRDVRPLEPGLLELLQPDQLGAGGQLPGDPARRGDLRGADPDQGVVLRDFVSIAVLPPWCLAVWAVVILLVNRRLLRPPDVGSEGKDVVDEEQEMKYAIGVVIDRDLFPDKLFAPAKRTDLMPDGTNPVLDKELRSEIFSQGTLMLRVVIQVSMLLSIPLMAALLFLKPENAGYYVSYVVTFNLLVGPVFSAGSITQERERQTLNLLLTTLLTPGKIVFAKLLAALRVSTVLTFLLTEQLLLAYLLIPELRDRLWTLVVFLAIIATTCLATSTIGLLCSALSRKTSVAMVVTYMALLVLFVGPVGVRKYLEGFGNLSYEKIEALTITSPYSAAFSIPMRPSQLSMSSSSDASTTNGSLQAVLVPGIGLPVWAVFLLLYPILAVVLYGATYLAFRIRWWKAGGTG